MREYTEGSIRRKCKRNGSWEWFGEVSYTEDGKQKRIGHFLGVACDAPKELATTESSTTKQRRRRSETPTGKGANTAIANFRSWRDSLIQAERDAEAEAKRKAEEAAALAALPVYSTMPVPEFVRAYIADKEIAEHRKNAAGEDEDTGGIELSTLDNYKYVVRHLDYPELNVQARELKPTNISAWIKATKENEVGASMRAKAFSLLNYACAWGVKFGYIPAPNPCDLIDKNNRPTKLERKKNPLDDTQLARLNTLLDTLAEQRERRDLADAARIALSTGMRQGEICGLRWKDVDFWNDAKAWEHPERWNSYEQDEIVGYIHINNVIADAGSGRGLYNKPYPKNRRRRHIPIFPEVAETLANRRRLALEECVLAGVPFTGELYVLGKPVSPDEAGTGFYSPDYLGHQWSMFAGMMGVKGQAGVRAHFHDLRHTFAVHYLANGIPLATVAGILGHANSQTTARYYEEFLTEAQRKAMWDMENKMTMRAPVGKVVQFRPTGTES